MIDKKRILNILEKCLEIKECGVDVFFRYSPHVQGISLQIHKDSWESKPEDYFVYVDEEDNLYEEKRLEVLEERLEEILREVKNED